MKQLSQVLRWWFVVVLLVCGVAGPVWADVDGDAEPSVVPLQDELVGPVAPASADPEWMRRSERSGGSGSSDHRRSALRSMGAMLLLVGVMLAANYWIRRRMNGAAPLLRSNRLKIVSRLRVGPRQEVVVVDWEGEQVMLGVGPNILQPLHKRISDPDGLEMLDEAVLEEAGYGA